MDKKHLTLPQTDTIEFSSFRFTGKGLEAVGNPTLEDWTAWGTKAHTFTKHMHFAIGDWLSYGEFHWKEKYEEAIELTGFDIQTLRNDKWVATRIPPERRIEELSFSHHQEVANMEEEEQQELLAKAVEQKLTRDQFRKLISKQDMQYDEKQKAPHADTSFAEVMQALTVLQEKVIQLSKRELTYDEYEVFSAKLDEVGEVIGHVTHAEFDAKA